jgi:hypothetical protein
LVALLAGGFAGAATRPVPVESKSAVINECIVRINRPLGSSGSCVDPIHLQRHCRGAALA